MQSLTRLFARRAPPARLPDGLRVYAIGDVHGCNDLLGQAEARIAADRARPAAAAETIVVFLGDYVDRGPDTRAVVDRLAARRFAGLPARFLLGNHEEALRRFLVDPVAGAAWLDWGGAETLASYGVAPAASDRPSALRSVAAALAEAMPAHHHDFLADLELSIELGGFLFVHAGIRPGVALDRQARTDLLGIREPFLSTRRALPRRVVHGHTIAAEIELLPHRIGVDTGAYRTGRLGIVRIEGADVTIV